MLRFFRAILITLCSIGLIGTAAMVGAIMIVPKATNTVPLRVMSPSMVPALNPYDLVLVDPTNKRAAEGDIITYHPESGSDVTVTHRVISPGTTKIVTKGDNNDVPDDPIVPEQVAGTVAHVIPQVGRALDYRNQLMVAVVVLSVVLVILIMLPSGKKARRATSQKKLN